MAQQHTQAAGSGHQAQDMRRIANETLARALELDQQSMLLSEHRQNLICAGEVEQALIDALLTACALLGAEGFNVRKIGQLLADLATQAERYQDECQRPDETPGACEQCGGHGMWRPPYQRERVPCDLCTSAPISAASATTSERPDGQICLTVTGEIVALEGGAR